MLRREDRRARDQTGVALLLVERFPSKEVLGPFAQEVGGGSPMTENFPRRK
jgi:hypothetical protein